MNELLRTALRERKDRITLFIGAGLSKATSEDDLSLWIPLLSDGIDYCRKLGLCSEKSATLYNELLSTDSLTDLLSVASMITNTLGSNEGQNFKNWIKQSIGQLTTKNPDLVIELGKLGFPIVTTNYDTLIEKCLGYSTFSWKDHDQATQILAGVNQQGVLHLHGHCETPSTIILDWMDYGKISGNKLIQDLLKGVDTQRTIIFVGYGKGMGDPNFQGFINWIRNFDIVNPVSKHFLLVKNAAVPDMNGDSNLPKSIVPVSFGEEHDDLLPFIKSMQECSRTDFRQNEPEKMIPKIHTYKLLNLPRLIDTTEIDRSFVGRSRPLQTMSNILQDVITKRSDGSMIMWASGFGGIGKSWFLRKSFSDVSQKYRDSVKIGFIDWHVDHLAQPYPKPMSVEQMLEVIGQRIGQLYGIDAIAEFIEALKTVSECREEYNVQLNEFQKILDDFSRFVSIENPQTERSGDHMPSEREINRSLLMSIFREIGVTSSNAKLRRYIESIYEEELKFEELFKTWIKRKVNSASDGMINPDLYLTNALISCIANACKVNPLFLILDTCELLFERQDRYLRYLFKSLLSEGSSFVVLMGNRFIPDIFYKNRSNRIGWQEEIGPMQFTNFYFDREPLLISDVDEMLENLTRETPVNEALAVNLHRLTKGVPFALKNIFDLHEKGDDILWKLDQYFHDIHNIVDELEAISEIYKRVCDRILIHVYDDPDHLEDITLLAVLQEVDMKTLRKYWGESPERRLQQLMMKHSFILNGDLHEDVRMYFRRHWRKAPPETIRSVIEKLNTISENERESVEPGDYSGFVRWLIRNINIKSWKDGEDVMHDLMKAYVIAFTCNQSADLVCKLAAELKTTNAGHQKFKEFLQSDDSATRYGIDLEHLLLIEEIVTADWSPFEKGCLYLFLAENYFKWFQNDRSIAWFDKAFESFETTMPRQSVMVKYYLDAVVHHSTYNDRSAIMERRCLHWSEKFHFAGEGFYFELGKVYHNTGNYEASNEMLVKALTANSQNKEALVYMVHNYASHQGLYQDALDALARYSNITDARLGIHKAKALTGLGRYHDAREEYERALSLGPGFEVVIHEDLADLLLHYLKDADTAFIHYTNAIKHTAKNSGRYAKLLVPAIKICKLKNDMEAELNFRQQLRNSIKENSLTWSDLNSIAWCMYRGEVDLDFAETVALDSLNKNKEVHNLQTLAAILVRNNKWTEATPVIIEWLTLLVNGSLTDKDFVYMYVDVVKIGKQEEMVQLLKSTSTAFALDAVCWALLKTISKENQISLSSANEDFARRLYAELSKSITTT